MENAQILWSQLFNISRKNTIFRQNQNLTCANHGIDMATWVRYNHPNYSL